LAFLLDNHGEDAVDSKERIRQKDLGTHNKEVFIQNFEESDYEILLVVIFDKTQARRKGFVVIEFFPKGLQCDVELIDMTSSLSGVLIVKQI